jgi:prepilin-type N-terminal cleavage/methylation domain-containing protein
MKSAFTLIEILIVIAVIAVLGVMLIPVIHGAVSSKPKSKVALVPEESTRFVETQVTPSGFGYPNPVYLLRDTKTGQEWLRAHQYGFAQVSPSASTPLRCEAEVPR